MCAYSCKAHGDSIPTASGASEVRKLGEEELQTLESAFEQVQYFVEDLDHAKGQRCMLRYLLPTQPLSLHGLQQECIRTGSLSEGVQLQ